MGMILALDLARVTGFAYGDGINNPISGSVVLAPPSASNASTGRGLLRWLTGFLTLSPASCVYIEAPLDPRAMGKKTSMMSARQLIGLAYLAETIVTAKGVDRVREARVQQVRKFFVGSARPDDGKAAVMRRCRELGLKYSDDNAADAIALLAYAHSIESGIGMNDADGKNDGVFASSSLF
jgi:hypothetical protein